MMQEIDGAQLTLALKDTETKLANASLKSKVDTLTKMMVELIRTNLGSGDFKVSEQTLKWFSFHGNTESVMSSVKKANSPSVKVKAPPTKAKAKPKSKKKASGRRMS